MTHSRFQSLAIVSSSFARNQILVVEAQDLADRVEIAQEDFRNNEKGLIQFLNESKAEAAIIGQEKLSDFVIKNLLYLKAIGKYGVGTDNIDFLALKERKIYFYVEPGINRRSVSELTLGFMLGHQRNIFKSIARMERQQWTKNGGFELSGKSIGLVGFGHVGQDVARILAPFKCEIFIHDIVDRSKEAKTLKCQPVSFDDLLSKVDILSFHVPLTLKTFHMLSQKNISKLKKHCLIINTSRGSVCHFDDVSQAVKNGTISGFATDVYEEEPFIHDQFKIENGFYFTPHIGGNTLEAVLQMGRSALKGLKIFLVNPTS